MCATSDGDVRMDPKRFALVVNADGTLEFVGRDDACGKYVYRDAPCETCGARKPVRRYEVHFASASSTSTSGLFVLVEAPE